MQNHIDKIFWGRTFKNTSYFNLRASEFWVLGPWSLTWDLGTRLLVPRSWYQDMGTKILVPWSWYQDPGTKVLVPRSLGEPVLHDGGTAPSAGTNRYPFWTVRTPQASLNGEKQMPVRKWQLGKKCRALIRYEPVLNRRNIFFLKIGPTHNPEMSICQTTTIT